MGAAWRVRTDHGRGQTIVLHPASPAQRHRHPAHGPRLQSDGDGRPHPLPPHARIQYPMGAGHRPCWHRHADRGGTAVADAGSEPPRLGARGLRAKGVGVEAAVWRHHHRPDAPHGRLGELGARILHHGRQALQGGGRDLRAAIRTGPDLPRQAPGELGPGAQERGERSGGGEPGTRRLHVAHLVSVQRRTHRWRSRHAHRHDTPRNHDGRRCVGSASGR
ncbi:hypothetical protein GALL_476220 [mine drainage metagenome]|uniref:Uncharacterized protein n=1 Tax=mine drainage metagenome TaxID=410659 RepID=A0A1J5PZS9_9ZZZZ